MISININGDLINFKIPKIMGILNITNNSFFDGGKYNSLDAALFRAEEIIKQGVDIIDIGAQSTKPGSKIISSENELKKILPVLIKIKENFPNTPISVDTFWSEVAEKSLDIGVSIINDVSSGSIDKNMFNIISKYRVPYILTHSIGTPKNMSHFTKNKNIIYDINIFFIKKINKLHSLGVKDIILDPGFGFSKKTYQNYHIINNIENIGFKEYPIIAGISRKSMIYKILNTTPDKILIETSALHLILLLKKISILRVHDIDISKKIIKISKCFFKKKS